MNLRERLTDWQGLLQRQTAEARQILRRLLIGRLVFTPREHETGRYSELAGKGSLPGVLLGGVVTLPTVWWLQGASPIAPARHQGRFHSLTRARPSGPRPPRTNGNSGLGFAPSGARPGRSVGLRDRNDPEATPRYSRARPARSSGARATPDDSSPPPERHAPAAVSARG